MATKKYDLAVKTGEYTDGQGQTKGRWQNVGAVMDDGNGGQFIMLAKWFNPAGVPDLQGRNSESVLLSMFEPKQRDNSAMTHDASQNAYHKPQQQQPAQGFQQQPQQQQQYHNQAPQGFTGQPAQSQQFQQQPAPSGFDDSDVPF